MDIATFSTQPFLKGSATRLSKQHRKLARPTHRSFRPPDLTGWVQPEIRDALQPFLDCHGHFHASEIGADATVNAQAKCGMAVLLAIDHDLVRIREHRGVTICGGK